MEKTIEIPEGYEARIEGNKVILERKESEDERIRRGLLKIFNLFKQSPNGWGGMEIKDIIAYLERQKEQQPSEWVLPEDFEEAVYKVANFISPFDNQEELRKTSHCFAEQLLSLAKKELGKLAEWSEEDRGMIQSIITGGCVDDKQEHWLRMLPERICQPKQEWSEEDETYLQDALWCVKQASNVARGENDMGACFILLKSMKVK